MPGEFIDVRVDPRTAQDRELATQLEEVCPVSIFATSPEGVRVVEDNLDECVLCDLCLDVAPRGSIEIVKLYER